MQLNVETCYKNLIKIHMCHYLQNAFLNFNLLLSLLLEFG